MRAGAEVRRIYSRLLRAFGPQHWWPGETPLEVVVGAVLTQNTAWSNVEKAIACLKQRKLMTLGRLAALPPARLAPAIRPAGFYNLKARRLLSVLRWFRSQGGFSALRRVPADRIRAGLLGCNGIGPETADSILLYALNRRAFVVDSYTRRILFRYGIIGGSETYDDIQALFHAALPRSVKDYNECHALLVRLAKVYCRSRPDCDPCPLAHD